MRYIAKRRYGVKIEQTRRDFLKTAALSVTAMGLPEICKGEKSLSWLGSAKRAKTGGTLPNFVIIFLDDSGWADFKPFSTPAYETPNVEQLAKGGCCFHNFYVTQAVCSASRASLLAGCYPGRTKVFGAHAPRARGLDPKCATIGEVLKARGYTTAVFGKWHIGDQPDTRPPARGFIESCGLMYSNDMWEFHPENPKYWGKYPLRGRIEIKPRLGSVLNK